MGACFGGAPSAPEVSGPPLLIFDLFCGAGGFSAGAVAAGHIAHYACDADADALETHRRNHPHAQHVCTRLPAPVPFPKDAAAAPFHVHGSPPCQKYSLGNSRNRGGQARAVADTLIEWYLETALHSGATSWSMEQVYHPDVIKIVERVRREHPTRVAYAKFDFAALGVPQTRVRLLAGTPALISALQRRTHEQPRRSVRDVLSAPRGTHIKNTKTWVAKRKRDGAAPGEPKYVYQAARWHDNLVPVSRPAPTVCAKRNTDWVDLSAPRDAAGQPPHCGLNIREYSVLQTFPDSYLWPSGLTLALKQIGNAVPPHVATLLLQRPRS